MDAVFSFLLKGFSSISNFLVILVLSRLLTVSDMGFYMMAQSLAIFVAMFARMGMKQPVVQLVSESLANGKPQQIAGILGSVLTIVTIGLVAVGMVLWFGAGELILVNTFSSEPIYQHLAIWITLIVILAYQVPLVEAFRGLHKVRRAQLYDGPLANFILLVILTVVFFISGQLTYVEALITLTVAFAISLAVNLYELAGFVRWHYVKDKYYSYVSLIKLGLPVQAINMTAYLVSQSGLWICAAFLPSDQVGIYGVVIKLVLIISLPVFVLNMILQPVIVHMNTLGNKKELELKVRKATTVAVVPSIFFSVCILFFAEEIMKSVFGVEYVQGSNVLIMMTLAQFVNVWVGPCLNLMLLTGGRVRATMVVMITGAISVLLSLYWVDEHGITGVAMASMIGLMMQNVIIWLLAMRVNGVSTHAYSNPYVVYQLFAGFNLSRLLKRKT